MAANSKLIAVNVGLAAALALIAWQGRVRWVEARAQRHANLNQPIRHIIPPRPVPDAKPEGVQAAKYADVATKNLFSKDRNPTVIVEPPKVEAPKVMPPLPVVYGVLTLPSGTKAIMAEKSGASSKTVHAGDAIGDFKILALDANKVTFEWDGKPLERNIDDLVDHSGATAAAGAAGPAAPPPAAAAPAAPPTAAALGADNGTPKRPRKPASRARQSPIGTVVDGYRKTGAMSPFGIDELSLGPEQVACSRREKPNEKRVRNFVVDRRRPGCPGFRGTGPSAPKRAKKATAASKATTPQPVTIPADATANADGTFSWTDKQGKKWTLREDAIWRDAIRSDAGARPLPPP